MEILLKKHQNRCAFALVWVKYVFLSSSSSKNSQKQPKTISIPHWWGILVQLVMLVSRGHWKNSIQTSWEKYSFSYLVPVYTDSNKKKTIVHLIAPFANILCIILTFQLSPWNTKKSKLFIKWHFWLPCTCISYY